MAYYTLLYYYSLPWEDLTKSKSVIKYLNRQNVKKHVFKNHKQGENFNQKFIKWTANIALFFAHK